MYIISGMILSLSSIFMSQNIFRSMLNKQAWANNISHHMLISSSHVHEFFHSVCQSLFCYPPLFSKANKF